MHVLAFIDVENRVLRLTHCNHLDLNPVHAVLYIRVSGMLKLKVQGKVKARTVRTASRLEGRRV
jgi:hypothetical protein